MMRQHTGTVRLEELVGFRMRYKVRHVNRPDECMCYKLVIPATKNNYSVSSNKIQGRSGEENSTSNSSGRSDERIIPYPTAFPYGNGMVLHFYQQQESSTTKTVHKVINKGLKTYV